MGRYSSDSESSRSHKYKKSKKSSRRSSSRSASPKRCRKKQKKRSHRSSSKDRKTRHSSDKKSSYRRRSRSPKDRHRKKRSSSRDSARGKKDSHRKSKHSRSKRRHRSSSTSSSSRSPSKHKSQSPKKKCEYDPDELLETLNKAAIEAMAVNRKRKSDPMASMEMQIKRHDAINELRASGSTGIISQFYGTPAVPLVSLCPPSQPLSSTKQTDLTILPDAPIVVNVNEPSCSFTPSTSANSNNSLLHSNFLLENQEEKLNRWVKKLFLIRQRAISGEMISV